ncbi:MAG: SpoIIE family protein phosphatase [Bacteroidota bacterium]
MYRAGTKKAEYLIDRGTALGMVKGKEYCNFVETNTIPYQSGDVMVLFTDGITEAKSPKGDEFGLDLLKKTIEESVSNSPA